MNPGGWWPEDYRGHSISTMDAAPATSPLMEDIVHGYADDKGSQARTEISRFHYWYIPAEVGERFAYYGIASNLITYLTGQLGQSTATAAENVNIWSGTASLMPLLGAFVADSFLGRCRTVIVASLVYILGLSLLTLSVTLTSLDLSGFQVVLFFSSLYLVALAQGGHKPNLQAFGADQFDGQDPIECKAKGSFFNWWYFSLSASILSTQAVLVYIQDNLNWALGFGIPCTIMVAGLLLFLLGRRTYRYCVKGNEKNPFTSIGRVFIRSIRNWRSAPPPKINEEEGCLYPHSSQQYKFLNKALLAGEGSMEDENECSVSDVEEAKALLTLIPIWVTSLVYAIVFAQTTTFFTKQGATMDRTLFPGFKIPAASLQCFIGIAIILLVPIYDRVFVPAARSLTAKASGITMLQRIGTGMVFSAISMVVAALVEMKRLETAKEYGLVNLPNATVPMTVWWLVPQYVLGGISDVFAIVGLQEFFYDQVPKELRSVGLSFFHSCIGVGSFLSSLLISVIDKATGGDGGESWFSNNLNQGHLDYFYWLLAGLSAVGFTVFLYFAKSYVYIT